MTSIAKPGALRGFVTATVLYSPPLRVEDYPKFSGLENDDSKVLVAMRCRPPNPEKVDAVLATWPNVFAAVERDVPAATSDCDSSPPDPDKDGYDAVIAYCMRYSMAELLKAGHATEVSETEVRAVTASATYQLLHKNGLRLKLTDAECQGLAELAAKWEVRPEEVVRKFIHQLLGDRCRKRRRKATLRK